MANQLDQELIRRMLEAQANPTSNFDPSRISSAVGQGLDLAGTVQAQKQGQEDRVRALAEKIEQAKKQRAVEQKLQDFGRGFGTRFPKLAEAGQTDPEQAIKFEFAARQQADKDAAEAQRAQIAASAKTKGTGLTPGQIAADRAFAKDFVTFETGGGKQAAETSLGKLSTSISALDALTKQTPAKKFAKRVVSAVTPESGRGLVTPGLVELQEDLRSNVLGSLRATLGPQFTEKEGERILSQTFNPTLDPSVNLKRAKRLETELGQAKKAKEAANAYFKRTGTLAGFSGFPPSIGGIPVTAQDFGFSGDEPGIPVDDTLTPDEQAELEALREQFGG